MIGQRELLNKIDAQIERNKFPKVSILIGEQGSGRKTLANHIAKKLNVMLAIINPTLDEVVETHNAVYNDISAVYVFSNCDYMPNKAMDILRSMIENLPDDVYFILTCESLDNIFPEIKSMSVTYMMEPYSDEDKCDWLYENEVNDLTEDDEEFLLETASNIGEVKQMCYIDIKSFKEYVKSVLDTLASNSDIPHEIGSEIDFYGESDKFPIRLFWRAFIAICGDRLQSQKDSLMYCRFIAITGDSIQELVNKDSNMKEVFESWVNQIREEFTVFLIE